MSERFFLFIVGVYILTGLYFEVDMMIYLLSLWLVFEGVTNLRLTTFSQKFIGKTVPAGLTVFQTQQRFSFDAFRAWRIMVAVMLGGAFLLLNEHDIEIVWFFPWFMGFAIMGAGASGVCPMILFIRWIGFK
ncbi:MAG: hypothetical protein KAJ32_06625 [Gammaproteobacteria bacterium]|nr:hypothetical protein [Gammaproteobacteria bacterium]